MELEAQRKTSLPVSPGLSMRQDQGASGRQALPTEPRDPTWVGACWGTHHQDGVQGAHVHQDTTGQGVLVTNKT